jgi:antitoxin component of RelBE/YafQ-DinJ toxin-antitoxin module
MTRDKVMVSMPHDLADAARQMSAETGIPLSTAVQRLLEYWIANEGKLPKRLSTERQIAKRKGGAKPKTN